MAQMGDAQDVLDVGWFDPQMAEPERTRLAALARVAAFPTGHVFVREGDAAADLGIVLSGRIALRLHVPGRPPLTVLTVEAGDVFLWSAVVPPYRASSTLVAVEPVEAILFDAASLRQALADDPQLASIVYPRLLRALARRLAATRLQLLDLFSQEAPPTW